MNYDHIEPVEIPYDDCVYVSPEHIVEEIYKHKNPKNYKRYKPLLPIIRNEKEVCSYVIGKRDLNRDAFIKNE
jgi:hypothetical protein